MTDSAVLMSIRPRFAEAILSGEKTVELRRRRPGFAQGTTVLVYSSAPEQVVCGAFRAGPVVAAPLDDLWSLVGDRAAVTRDEFDVYFQGCDTGYAIEVRDPQLVPRTALKLRPPQSYLLLRPEDEDHAPLWALAATMPRAQLSLPLKAAGAALRVAQRFAGSALARAKPGSVTGG